MYPGTSGSRKIDPGKAGGSRKIEPGKPAGPWENLSNCEMLRRDIARSNKDSDRWLYRFIGCDKNSGR